MSRSSSLTTVSDDHPMRLVTKNRAGAIAVLAVLTLAATAKLTAAAGTRPARHKSSIVFMRQTLLSGGDANCQALFAIRPNGTNPHRLSQCGSPPSVSWSTSPSWSPDGKRIAFARCPPNLFKAISVPGCYELYVMNADGSHLRRLTHNRVDDDHPSWSPDGKRLAFTRGPTGPADLWIIKADGSQPHRLTKDRLIEANPVWSPAGGLIAFMQFHGANDRRVSVSVIRPDGTRRRDWIAIEYAAGGNFQQQVLYGGPTWSPDGRRLALTVRGGLEIVTPAGRLVHVYAVGGSDGRGFHPSWSPDGRSIAFVRFDDPRSVSGSLHVLTLPSGAVRPLTSATFPMDDEQPDW